MSFEDDERATTEFRCRMSEEVLAMLGRARRMYSLEQDKPVTTVEVLEWALASYISSQPVDEESLEKVRLEMDKDLQAEKAREIPLVAHAREVAVEMGCIPIPRSSELESESVRVDDFGHHEFARAGEPGEQNLVRAEENSSVSRDTASADSDPGSQAFARAGKPGRHNLARAGENYSFDGAAASSDSDPTNQSFDRAGNSVSDRLTAEETARGSCCGGQEQTHDCCQHTSNGLELAAARANSEYLEALKNTLSPIQNTRVCFNPHNRFATKAQKREVLGREGRVPTGGGCCAVPGCPHKIWLHLHHLIPYSHGGPTLPWNSLGICVSCHCNVHDGLLKIFLNDKGKLVFTDADGNCLTEQADLMLAGWLDFYEGWQGEREDSYKMRWGRGDWSVFEG